MTDDADVAALAERVLADLRAAGQSLATAESCTGGLIAGALTEIAGSSDVVDRGYVTYSNAAKSDMLGVDPALIATHGAVSEPVARAMAEGALRRSGAARAVAVTGVAGPGYSENKPAGLVFISWAGSDCETRVEECRFSGDRRHVRRATVIRALEGLRSDR
jgi:nicotinamide-nucleotide amidase